MRWRAVASRTPGYEAVARAYLELDCYADVKPILSALKRKGLQQNLWVDAVCHRPFSRPRRSPGKTSVASLGCSVPAVTRAARRSLARLALRGPSNYGRWANGASGHRVSRDAT